MDRGFVRIAAQERDGNIDDNDVQIKWMEVAPRPLPRKMNHNVDGGCTTASGQESGWRCYYSLGNIDDNDVQIIIFILMVLLIIVILVINLSQCAPRLHRHSAHDPV